jgi:RNA ligase
MKTLLEASKKFNIPVVKAIDGLSVQNIELFVKQIREWQSEEGVVVRFSSGQMVKIKADQYVLRHKSKDSISQEKNVLQTILDDSVDDLIPLLTAEDGERVQRFQSAFWAALEDVGTDIHDLYIGIDKGQDQKEFAMSVMKDTPKHLQNFMFGLRRGVPVKTLLVDQIGKSLNSQTKIDSSRWMWSNLNWNHSDIHINN